MVPIVVATTDAVDSGGIASASVIHVELACMAVTVEHHPPGVLPVPGVPAIPDTPRVSAGRVRC